MFETNFQGIFKVGVGNFRRKNGVGVAVQFADQRVEMRTNKLNIENSVPAMAVQFFMGTAQMGADDDPAIAFGQFMNSVKRQVQEPPDAGVIADTITFGSRYEGNIEIDSDEYGFVDQMLWAQILQSRQS